MTPVPGGRAFGGGFRMASAIGLRHPASASCLGRHLRLAGRCPNNSSLFPPLAAVVVVALWTSSAERLFLFRNSGKSADFPELPFHGRGRGGKRHLQRRFLRKRGAAGESFLQTFSGLNSLSQSLTALTAPSGREPLAWRESFRLKHKACGWECSPWGSCRAAIEGL